jgi:hypothetical protein
MRRVLASLLLIAATPAGAQERPAITPARDVAVTYRVTTEGQPPAELRMSWLAARNLMRMDLPGGQGWIVVDMTAGRAFMVTQAQRMIMDMPASGVPANMTPDATARFTREGQARVANTDCVNWRMEGQGEAARVCLTAEGVMLRTESLGRPGSRSGLMEATALAFGAQDPARFERPPGYQSLQLPSAIPGGGGMPRGTALPPPGLTIPAR